MISPRDLPFGTDFDRRSRPPCSSWKRLRLKRRALDRGRRRAEMTETIWETCILNGDLQWFIVIYSDLLGIYGDFTDISLAFYGAFHGRVQPDFGILDASLWPKVWIMGGPQGRCAPWWNEESPCCLGLHHHHHQICDWLNFFLTPRGG